MTRSLLPFLFLLLASELGLAQTQTAPAPVDPYGGPFTMPSGGNKGKLLDTSTRRSVVILTGAAAEVAHPGPGDTVIANFFSEGKFWIAKIPADAVQDVVVQLEHFPAIVPAGHIEGRFLLKPGKAVELFPQVGTEQPKTKFLTDIISSNEAVTMPGGKFDVVKGLLGNFGLGMRIMNAQDRYDSMVTAQHHVVQQFKLNITPEEKQNILKRAITLSDETGMSRLYNTVLRSCSTVWFHEIMDHEIHYSWNRKLSEVLGMLPTNAPAYLKLRGIIDAGSMMPTFQAEYEARAAKAAFDAKLDASRGKETYPTSHFECITKALE